MTAVNTHSTDIVADPVSHISISGVHGRHELDERLANARVYRAATGPLKPMLFGAALGAAIMFLLRQ